VLLVEDLTTDGRSKIKFCEALREAGAVVSHTFVVFYYGVFSGTEETLAEAGLQLHALATWHDVLAASKRHGYFDAASRVEVEKFLADPAGWSVANGGQGPT
jgi:orotate phosphoribosyltransferase